MIGGVIGGAGLADWWLKTFTRKERVTMSQAYQPAVLGGHEPLGLDSGPVFRTRSVQLFLAGLANGHRTPARRSIGLRLMEKAATLDDARGLDRHFFLQQVIQFRYAGRDIEPGAFDDAVAACRAQIAMAPEAAKLFRSQLGGPLPRPVGYTQLAIILEKQHRFDEAIALCEQALAQEWAGDWTKRIARCTRKSRDIS